MTTIKQTIKNIRLFVAKNKITPYRLCKEAGLHRNTLHRIKHDDWNPTISTIEKIERVIKIWRK